MIENLIHAISDAQAEIDHIDFLTLELNDVIRKQEIRKRFLIDVRLPALQKLGQESVDDGSPTVDKS